MQQRNRLRNSLAAAMLPLAAPCGGAAYAQGEVLEEIVVTAQKREQNLQDVGLAVTAFSGEALRALGYTDSIDIAAQTPGLNIIQFHPSVTNVNIRGVSQNEFADHLEPPIAMFVDNAYVSAMGGAHVQMFDIERVEVLRGPQGTLFGRNATGGLVHFISAAPTEEADGYASATVGNYGAIQLEGAIGGGLADSLQARLSAALDQNDGYLKNAAGDDLRDADSVAVRLQVAWQPSDAVDVLAKVHYSQDDGNGNAYQHDATFQNALGLGERIADDLDYNDFGLGPGTDFNGYRDADGDPFAGEYDDIGFFAREIVGGNLQVTWSLNDSVALTSVTNLVGMEKDYREDADSSPFPYFNFETTQDFDQFSQELRLHGANERLNWQTGVYYLNIDTDIGSSFDLDFFTFGEGEDFGQVVNTGGHDSTVKTKSWALFAQSEYDLGERLSATLGVRYTEDDRKADYVGFDNFGGGPNIPDSGDLSFNNFSYKAQLNWRPSDGVLAYAGITQTHKAGNFRLGIGDPNLLAPHDEEELRSVEIGWKTNFADGRARLNASAFYYDYADYQAFVVDPTTGVIAALDIVNVDAKAVGIEVELAASPFSGLDLSLGAAWMDSKVKDVAFPDGATVRDTELPYAPDFSVNGLARFSWPLGGGTASVQADFNYSDSFCFSVLCAPLDQEGSYVVANARAQYAFPGGRWSVTAFVNNLAEEEYRLYSLDVSGLGIAADAYGNPRTYGVTVYASL